MIIETVVTHISGSALKAIADHLSEAKQYSKEDVRSCQAYLNAANEAIVALEAAFDLILVQAKITNLDADDEVDQLYGHIETYLTVDKYRPKLMEAVAGLKGCREALVKHADTFLQWPWKKDDRQEAVKEFSSLLGSLELYLNALAQKGFHNDISGVGAPSLVKIQVALREYQAQKRMQGTADRVAFLQLIQEIQKNRSKDFLMDRIDEIQITIRKLTQAFR